MQYTYLLRARGILFLVARANIESGPRSRTIPQLLLKTATGRCDERGGLKGPFFELVETGVELQTGKSKKRGQE